MDATVNPIIKLLESRLNNSMDALEAITPLTLNNEHVPEIVQKMREEEAGKIRAVIKEQRDLISILKYMYPSA